MRNLMKKMNNEEGFTLLEMSIVLLVVAALLILIIPNATNVNDRTSSTTTSAAVASVEAQILLYKMDHPEEADLTGDALLTKLVTGKYISPEQQKAYENRNAED